MTCFVSCIMVKHYMGSREFGLQKIPGNHFPKGQISSQLNSKAFADDKIDLHATEISKFALGRVENCGKRRKC